MKRFISFLLCAVLIIVLAACGIQITEDNKNVEKAETAKDYAEVYAAVKKIYDETQTYDLSTKSEGVYFETDSVAEAPEEAAGDGGVEDYVGTNVQVEGIDEADIVKTDGEYIYATFENSLAIYKASGADSVLLKTIDFEDAWPSEMFLSGDRLIVIVSGAFYCTDDAVEDVACIDTCFNSANTEIYIYDVSSPEDAQLLHKLAQDGYYSSSRLFKGKLYMISNYSVWNEPVETKPETFIPRTYCDGEAKLVPADCIEILPENNSTSYSVCACYDVDRCELVDTESILGYSEYVYMSENSIYFASTESNQIASGEYEKDGYTVVDYKTENYTDIRRVSIENGLDLVAEGRVDGRLDSQFSLDEYKGNLRVVTTSYYDEYSIYTDKKHHFENYEGREVEKQSDNALYILDGNLKQVSAVEGLAENEYVYSVRFDGDYVYFCTFRQTDPLFAVNVSNPSKPEILSKFKISGFSDYLHVWSGDLLFGLGMEADENGATDGLKLVMFDTSDKRDIKDITSLIIPNSYSEALYNHKALLIVPEKGMIAFQVDDKYCLFNYSDETGFEIKQSIDLPETWGSYRGVNIGDCVYVIHDSGLSVIDINSFAIIAEI